MNPELEKLVDIALVDGYITDKEKEVLKRKAVSLGFDVEELEIILDGRLYENNKSMLPKVNKCHSCGEVMKGISKVCPACDYVHDLDFSTDSDGLDDSLHKLRKQLVELEFFKKPSPKAIKNTVFKIIITCGLYIVYKVFIKKEPLFDRYAEPHQAMIIKSDHEVNKLHRKYGANPEIYALIKDIIDDRDTIIKKRNKLDLIRGLISLTIWCTIIGFIFYLGSRPPAPPTAEKQLQQLIEENKVSAAKAMLLTLEEDPENSEEYYAQQIQLIEIDSFAESGNYNEALRLANLIKNGTYSNNREDKIDEIITKEVIELIAKKEFKQAKKKAGLSSYSVRDKLENQIKLAEEIK